MCQEISIPSAYYLEYKDNGKTMKIAMDFRDSTPILTYRAIVNWEPPDHRGRISHDEKKKIMENIIDYLNIRRGFRFEVDGGELSESRYYPGN